VNPLHLVDCHHDSEGPPGPLPHRPIDRLVSLSHLLLTASRSFSCPTDMFFDQAADRLRHTLSSIANATVPCLVQYLPSLPVVPLESGPSSSNALHPSSLVENAPSSCSPTAAAAPELSSLGLRNPLVIGRRMPSILTLRFWSLYGGCRAGGRCQARVETNPLRFIVARTGASRAVERPTTIFRGN
jgi:hypothetical protein